MSPSALTQRQVGGRAVDRLLLNCVAGLPCAASSSAAVQRNANPIFLVQAQAVSRRTGVGEFVRRLHEFANVGEHFEHGANAAACEYRLAGRSRRRRQSVHRRVIRFFSAAACSIGLLNCRS